MSIYFSGDSPLPSATSTPRISHLLNENQDSPNDSTVPRTPCIDKSDFSTNDQSVPRTPVPFLSQSPRTSLAMRRADLITSSSTSYSFPVTPIQHVLNSADFSTAISDQCVPSILQGIPCLSDDCGPSTPNFITLDTLDCTPSPRPRFDETVNALQGRNRTGPEFARLSFTSRRRLSLGWERTRCNEGLDTSLLAAQAVPGSSVRRRSLDESHSRQFSSASDSCMDLVFASYSERHNDAFHIKNNLRNCEGPGMSKASYRNEDSRETVPECRNTSNSIYPKDARKLIDTSKSVADKHSSRIYVERKLNKPLVSSLNQTPLHAAGDAHRVNYLSTDSSSLKTPSTTSQSPGHCETLLEALDHISESDRNVQSENSQSFTGTQLAAASTLNSVCRREDTVKQRRQFAVRLKAESSTCQHKDETCSQIDLFTGNDVFA